MIKFLLIFLFICLCVSAFRFLKDLRTFSPLKKYYDSKIDKIDKLSNDEDREDV